MCRYHASPETVNAAGLSGDSILLSPKFAMSFLGPWALGNFQRADVRVGLAMLPVAALFVFFQRYIMSGIATTGLKG